MSLRTWSRENLRSVKLSTIITWFFCIGCSKTACKVFYAKFSFLLWCKSLSHWIFCATMTILRKKFTIKNAIKFLQSRVFKDHQIQILSKYINYSIILKILETNNIMYKENSKWIYPITSFHQHHLSSFFSLSNTATATLLFK